MGKVVEDVRELIGDTPMLHVKRFLLPEGVNIYAKLEYMNPGGSIKDRTCMTMLREAEKAGKLAPFATIIEPTAGNTGIGLALATINLGYKLILVVPQHFSQEKQDLMRALGAEIVNTPRDQGMQGAIDKAKQLSAAIPNSFVPNQFSNPANPLAHYETTGPEIYAQLAGNIDYFLAGAGSGGTFSGAARFLKEQNPAIKAIVVEPVGSIFGGGEAGQHKTEGIGNDFFPDTLDMGLADAVITVSDENAFNMVKELAQREGTLVGSSSGAAFYAAWQLAEQLTGPANIVTIFPDGSDRYLSKQIYNGGI